MVQYSLEDDRNSPESSLPHATDLLRHPLTRTYLRIGNDLKVEDEALAELLLGQRKLNCRSACVYLIFHDGTMLVQMRKEMRRIPGSEDFETSTQYQALGGGNSRGPLINKLYLGRRELHQEANIDLYQLQREGHIIFMTEPALVSSIMNADTMQECLVTFVLVNKGCVTWDTDFPERPLKLGSQEIWSREYASGAMGMRWGKTGDPQFTPSSAAYPEMVRAGRWGKWRVRNTGSQRLVHVTCSDEYYKFAIKRCLFTEDEDFQQLRLAEQMSLQQSRTTLTWLLRREVAHPQDTTTWEPAYDGPTDVRMDYEEERRRELYKREVLYGVRKHFGEEDVRRPWKLVGYKLIDRTFFDPEWIEAMYQHVLLTRGLIRLNDAREIIRAATEGELAAVGRVPAAGSGTYQTPDAQSPWPAALVAAAWGSYTVHTMIYRVTEQTIESLIMVSDGITTQILGCAETLFYLIKLTLGAMFIYLWIWLACYVSGRRMRLPERFPQDRWWTKWIGTSSTSVPVPPPIDYDGADSDTTMPLLEEVPMMPIEDMPTPPLSIDGVAAPRLANSYNNQAVAVAEALSLEYPNAVDVKLLLLSFDPSSGNPPRYMVVRRAKRSSSGKVKAEYVVPSFGDGGSRRDSQETLLDTATRILCALESCQIVVPQQVLQPPNVLVVKQTEKCVWVLAKVPLNFSLRTAAAQLQEHLSRGGSLQLYVGVQWDILLERSRKETDKNLCLLPQGVQAEATRFVFARVVGSWPWMNEAIPDWSMRHDEALRDVSRELNLADRHLVTMNPAATRESYIVGRGVSRSLDYMQVVRAILIGAQTYAYLTLGRYELSEMGPITEAYHRIAHRVDARILLDGRRLAHKGGKSEIDELRLLVAAGVRVRLWFAPIPDGESASPFLHSKTLVADEWTLSGREGGVAIRDQNVVRDATLTFERWWREASTSPRRSILGWCYPIRDEDDQPGMTEERLRVRLSAQRRDQTNPEDTGGAGSAQEDVADTRASYHAIPRRLITDARRRNLTPVAAVHTSRSSTLRANIMPRNPRYADIDVSFRANDVRRRVGRAVGGRMQDTDMEEVD